MDKISSLKFSASFVWRQSRRQRPKASVSLYKRSKQVLLNCAFEIKGVNIAFSTHSNNGERAKKIALRASN